MENENRTWLETLDLLRDEYVISIRDACEILKASRTWVNRYVKPHVRSIYLNSNRRYGKQMAGKLNWVAVAARELDREMTESVWLSKTDFFDLLSRSVVSVTKQTKRVPATALMAKNDAETYLTRREALLTRLSNPKLTDEEYEAVAAEFAENEVCHLGEKERELIGHRCGVAKRGSVPREEVSFPGGIDPMRWIAPHDIKGYGDTDEDVYRRFFRGGYYRVELAMADADGVPGSKIFYLEDPENLEGDGEIYIIPEGKWREHKAGNL